MSESEEKQLISVFALIKDAGYDPYAQLYGYVQTGDSIYITRKGNARNIIESIQKKSIEEYLKKHELG